MVGVRQGATGPGRRPRATPVQDNARPLTRMSNLQTLIGNSSKYSLPRVPLSVGLFLKTYMHCGLAAILTTFCDFVKMISTFPHHWHVYYRSLLACIPPACLLSVDVLKTFPFELCCVSLVL